MSGSAYFVLTLMLLKASVLIAMLLFEMLTLNPNCVRLQARVSVVVLEYTADGGMCGGNRGGTYPPEGVWPDATATHLSPDVAILGTACVDLPAAPPTSGMYVAEILISVTACVPSFARRRCVLDFDGRLRQCSECLVERQATMTCADPCNGMRMHMIMIMRFGSDHAISIYALTCATSGASTTAQHALRCHPLNTIAGHARAQASVWLRVHRTDRLCQLWRADRHVRRNKWRRRTGINGIGHIPVVDTAPDDAAVRGQCVEPRPQIVPARLRVVPRQDALSSGGITRPLLLGSGCIA